MNPRNLLYVLVGLILGLIGSTQLPLHAQKPPREVVHGGIVVQDAPHEIESRPAPPPASSPPPAVATTTAKASLQDSLLRPYSFAFDKPTTLSEVSRRLTADLGGPVVLDLAALERLELKPDDSVELKLKGVRLKTGLKLLLDQQGLTFRLIPEDNLLILTDKEGADDPIDKVWTEVSHLHRDVHDIQNMVEDLHDLSSAGPGELEADGGPRLRQPTILEEMPEVPGGAPAPGVGPKPEAQPEPKDARPANPPKRPRTRL